MHLYKLILKERKENGSCLNLENGSCLMLWRDFKTPEVIPEEADRISPSWAVNTLQLPHSQRSLAPQKKSPFIVVEM